MPHTDRLRTWLRVVVCAALLVLSAHTALAQQPTPGAPTAADGGRADYVLGPGDLLIVRIQGVGEYHKLRVSNSGRVRLPFLGVRRVADLTVRQLELEVIRALQEKGLVNDPWVHIDMEQRRAHPVYILGEVMMCGQFILDDGMRVLDLVAQAGGMNELATPVAYLYRRSPAKTDQSSDAGPVPEAWSDEVIPVDFDKIAGDTGSEFNIELKAGDVLYVPERRKLRFYVVGDVANPGAFEFPQKGAHPKGNPAALSATQMRVSEAVARAGGPMKTAKAGQGVLVRLVEDGTRRQIPVDLTAILQGRRPDIPIAPDDVIYIPGSAAKSIGASILRILPTVLAGAVLF